MFDKEAFRFSRGRYVGPEEKNEDKSVGLVQDIPCTKKGLKCAPVVELAKLVILCQQP